MDHFYIEHGKLRKETHRAIMKNLMTLCSPEVVKLIIGDSPLGTYNAASFYKPDALLGPNVELRWTLANSDDVRRFLYKIHGEAIYRHQEFQMSDVPDFKSYNNNSVEPLPRLVVLIDFFDYFLSCLNSEEIEVVESIILQGRQLGIHLVVGGLMKLDALCLSSAAKDRFMRVWTDPVIETETE